MRPVPTSLESLRPTALLGRRIAIGYALVASVAVIMCGMLFGVVRQVSGIVAQMRSEERAISQSHLLATAVREQYMHQAHTIIEQDASHIGHYEEWVARVASAVQELGPLTTGSSGQARLESVKARSQQLDAMFREQILPAVRRDDQHATVRLHHAADSLSAGAASDADFLAALAQQRMVDAHQSATRAVEVGITGASLCIALVVSLALGYTLMLRKAVFKPLAALAGAARRFGAGDFSARLGPIGEGELRAFSEAFDRMAEEIEARELRMLQAERMAVIGQLAAGVAHEINNPIGIIRGYLKTMTPDSERQTLQEELRILDEEAAACQRIAEDLLMYAKVTELQRAPTMMRSYLVESVQRFEEAGLKTEGRLVVNAQNCLAEIDPVRLRQLVFNLLSNASKVAPPGSPIEVVGTQLSHEMYEITVADRGPGVSKGDRQRIFEPFFSKTSGGSGLGLAVCESITRAHGGTITAEDNPLGGALFRVRFPVQPGIRSE